MLKNLFLLEDDPILGKGLKLLFELEDFSVTWEKTLAAGKEKIQKEQFDIAILDVGLPDGSGLDFCCWLRNEKYEFPIIILTAQTDEDSVVKGLTNGANDYVKKPFSNKELVARIKANTRSLKKDEMILKLGPLVINEETRRVEYNGIEIKFNRKEFDVLCLFARKEDVVISREMIIDQALNNIDVNDRTVDSHISHIRTKLQKAEVKELVLQSEYGVGYRLKVLC